MKETKYKGTQTEKNLEAAFAGESQARNKYTYFASVAKKEGYEQMSALFLKTAERLLAVLVIQLKTYFRLPKVKITNGLICTKILLRQPMKKDFMSLPLNSNLSRRLKNITKRDIALY